MLTNAILKVFGKFIEKILEPLGLLDISINFLTNVPYIKPFLAIIYYILPWEQLAPLIFLNVSFMLFRIAMAVIRLVKSFIPTMGGC